MKKQSHIHKKADSSASNPVRSQLQSRPFIAQAKPQSQKPLTQTQTENQEFQQQKFEATKLELQAKYGTITPEGQEQLTILQAKMSGSLQRRLQHASSNGSNFANIPTSLPDAPSQLAVQTKLKIGKPGDKFEEDADQFAEELDRTTNATISQQVEQNLQSEKMSLVEKEIQSKPMLQLFAAEGGMTATAGLETAIKQAMVGGKQLPEKIREPIEKKTGKDYKEARVHADENADQLCQAVHARAFTTGRHMFFAKGEYNTGSREGKFLINHEAKHIDHQNAVEVQRKDSSGLGRKSSDELREREQKIRRMPSQKRQESSGKKIKLEAEASKLSQAVAQVPAPETGYRAGFTMPVTVTESGGTSSVQITDKYFIRQYAQDEWVQVDKNGRRKTIKHKEKDDGYGYTHTTKGDQDSQKDSVFWVDEPGFTDEDHITSPAYIQNYVCNFRWVVSKNKKSAPYIEKSASIKMNTAEPNAQGVQEISYEGFAKFSKEVEVPEEAGPSERRSSKRIKGESANE